MSDRQNIIGRGWMMLLLLVGLTLITACNFGGGDTTEDGKLRTWLLVRAPEAALPSGQPVTVRSRSEDPDTNISHVELYAVELPTGEQNILIRADAAPFNQRIFTASQMFTPNQPGYYVIKVVGYNQRGDSSESEYIGFEVQ